jgi:hypothetical protein
MTTNAQRAASVVREVHVWAEDQVLDRTRYIFGACVSRQGISPGTPKDTRFLAAGWSASVNAQPRPPYPVDTKPRRGVFYSVPGDLEFDRGTRGFKLGDLVWIRNAVHYAFILLVLGRVRDSRGRWIGSPQAPHGTVPFAIRQAQIVFNRGGGG